MVLKFRYSGTTGKSRPIGSFLLGRNSCYNYFNMISGQNSLCDMFQTANRKKLFHSPHKITEISTKTSGRMESALRLLKLSAPSFFSSIYGPHAHKLNWKRTRALSRPRFVTEVYTYRLTRYFKLSYLAIKIKDLDFNLSNKTF